MENNPENTLLDFRSMKLRKLVFRAIEKGGRGHPGPALSLIEILRVLYDDVMTFDSNKPELDERDRLILSKGHGCLALYALLGDKGFFPIEELDNFCKHDALLGGHPTYGRTPGVEATTGSLGHGLSIASGIAQALKMRKSPANVYVVMGDGEINEGSVWEAAMSASHHKLDNLFAIVDSNKIQSYGPVDTVLDMDDIVAKWASFGFASLEVNGHDLQSLRDGLSELNNVKGKPRALICNTVKGKGVPFMENSVAWHHKSRLKPDELNSIYAALGEDNA